MNSTRTKTKTRTRKTRKVNTKPYRGTALAVFVLAFMGLTFAFLCLPAAANDKPKPYAVIFGTAYGPDDQPIYGAKITIRPDGKRHPTWELYSDHRGEFAQRVPPGPGDYVATGVVEVMSVENGKPQKSKKKRLTGEAKVHVAGEEERDFSLHLQ
jgi:hypothetical protein